ncbi:early transcribed membrane protein, putative [Plasmodium knowlesi strain H]|uniref:Early transcribed membrane protein, putative n=3 Tax=Plasmodium knowlesi TaxID=5850 RepID=A0A5K1UD47_PLAKH|nr:early transcribed membrane protein [Plasmodium knowlesi strain H]OTN68123.1 putative Early transcribed membrane protein [Plasmodium knowlesi]CAA9990276.1 early transcribed membrane protein [Plasmodium knowlesi strain H]SBO26746.1 early transcribed membrane protein, putative [Plasmodium knowlesi strain H]SBO28403.1 early transcribed membrane protein, putative [Plasmodium knowlesi strain H]VVS79750.1 early transcribed membrane protein [Plasmodium knowlesi strain H]|eukprot:XP_002258025.1 early transcribed membrane protein, putative [Plasmodium knowlesi strain H]
MRISCIFLLLNFLFIINLLAPCMCSENVVKKKVLNAFNTVSEKLNGSDKTKKNVALAGAATTAIALISTLIGGAYLLKPKRKNEFDDPGTVAFVVNLLLDTADGAVVQSQKGYIMGKDITKTFASEKELREYIEKNIKDSDSDTGSSQKKDLLNSIMHINVNIKHPAGDSQT